MHDTLCENCNKSFKPESEKDDLCPGCMYDLVGQDEEIEEFEVEEVL